MNILSLTEKFMGWKKEPSGAQKVVCAFLPEENWKPTEA